ncbi:MAG: anthranilate synthase component I family protein [Deltaproteobacteria bacterium]|nr:anthranilate synthase component I family protein [Deltaproteobacteria bacterium]MBW2256371.1 anthranilate synthase component I family protein [Deltaproteobacteria bacterium]
MKPPFDIAADLDTPVSAFLKLAPFRPRFLLESVEGGERVGRYSFIGFGDGLELRLTGDGFSLDGEVRPAPASTAEMLDRFRAALERAPRPEPAAGVPFAGGLVGVAGYDLVRRIERLPDRSAPVVGHPEAAYYAPPSLLVFDHVSRRVALLHDGPESERQALVREVVRALRGPVPQGASGGRTTAPVPSMDRAAYMRGVEATREHIAAGDVYQLVLSTRFSGETTLDPFQVYRALRLLNPSPYMYFCAFGDLSVVGSSPEALVRLQDRRATLRPIAGTRPRGATPIQDAAHEQDLLADPKEGAEHVMLVDLARNDLGRVAVPGSVRVDPYRKIERYSHVMHIVSGVEGVLASDADQFDLFAAAFPAGTVVGAPKVRAMELIEEMEPVRRGLYAGTVGYFGHQGTMDQAIAIRTLVFRDGGYSYQVGAGLVADSRPDSEHQEVMAKGAALGAALALAGEGL